MQNCFDYIPSLLSWFQNTELVSWLGGEYNDGVAAVIAVVLLAMWIFTKVLRAIIGVAFLLTLIYLACRLLLGIDPLAYLLP